MSGVFSLLCVIFLLVFSNILHAQEGNGTNLPPVIVLKEGAKIYSQDLYFNKQIDAGKLIVEGENIVFTKNKESQKILISSNSSGQKNGDNKMNHQNKNIELLKSKEDQKILAKEIKKYKTLEKFFDKKKFNTFPSSEEFAAASHVNKYSVAPNYSQNDFSKVTVQQNQNFVKSALDFLHSKKYTYYNSKSLDFCFSQVFSVRPPPSILALM